MNAQTQTQGRMLIAGELVASLSGEWIESVNPATEERIGEFPAGNAQDVARAVEAAAKAQPAWAALDMKARAGYLQALANRIRDHADVLLALEVADTGNTCTPMRGDMEAASSQLEWYAGLASEIKGETIPSTSRNLHMTVREPYGVVARIVPFNHPVMFAARGIAGPLMAGNTVVIKPPETSSLSSHMLGEFCRDVLPPGTVNIVTGHGFPTGDALVRHKDVKRIVFTGSVPTGMAIQRAAAETGVKNLTLELGGKNAFIVYPDADPQKVAQAAVAGMNFSWSGQSCGSTSRLMVHASLYRQVLDAVTALVAKIRPGDPMDPATRMGPLNSERHLARVNAMIQSGVAEGATLTTGGRRPPGEFFKRGYWVEPTVFGDVLPHMTVAREEIFGPVLAVSSWDEEEEEVIRLANSLEYGLTGAVWSNDITRALTTARRLQTGTVWVNGVGTHFKGAPYGGYKNSGIGRESCLDELLSYTEVKAIHVML